MGALGAAVATVFGYLCSDLYFLRILHKKSQYLSVDPKKCHVSAEEFKQVFGVGFTAALTNLMQSLTVIVLNQFLLSYGNMKRLIRFCALFLSGLSLIFTVFLFAGAGLLMPLFLKDTAIAAIGVEMLRWQVISTIFAGIVLLFTVLFQATGKILPSFLMSISRQGIVFLVILLLFVRLFHYQGILMAQAAADVLSALLAVALLFHNKDILGK